jgi:hypothetical protein
MRILLNLIVLITNLRVVDMIDQAVLTNSQIGHNNDLGLYLSEAISGSSLEAFPFADPSSINYYGLRAPHISNAAENEYKYQ